MLGYDCRVIPAILQADAVSHDRGKSARTNAFDIDYSQRHHLDRD